MFSFYVGARELNWGSQRLSNRHTLPPETSPQPDPQILIFFYILDVEVNAFFLTKLYTIFNQQISATVINDMYLCTRRWRFFFRILISLFLIMYRCIYLHMGMWHEFRGQRLWIPWSWNCRLFWDTWQAWREPNLGLPESCKCSSLQPQWWKVFTAACSYISQATGSISITW